MAKRRLNSHSNVTTPAARTSLALLPAGCVVSSCFASLALLRVICKLALLHLQQAHRLRLLALQHHRRRRRRCWPQRVRAVLSAPRGKWCMLKAPSSCNTTSIHRRGCRVPQGQSRCSVAVIVIRAAPAPSPKSSGGQQAMEFTDVRTHDAPAALVKGVVKFAVGVLHVTVPRPVGQLISRQVARHLFQHRRNTK